MLGLAGTFNVFDGILPALPLWSLAMFSIDILIIYGLAVRGIQAARLTDPERSAALEGGASGVAEGDWYPRLRPQARP
jgi:hypothetical protein